MENDKQIQLQVLLKKEENTKEYHRRYYYYRRRGIPLKIVQELDLDTLSTLSKATIAFGKLRDKYPDKVDLFYDLIKTN